jgi:hypothetical protein
MVSTGATDGSLPRLRRALTFAARGVGRTTVREAWYGLAWRWLALLGVLFVIDLLFGMPVWLRWLGLAIQAAIIIAGVVEVFGRRKHLGSSEEWAARVVEQQLPEIDNALINAVQFERALAEASPEQSALMRQEMARGEQVAGSVNVAGVVDRAGERRALRRLSGTAAVWALVALLFPGGFLAVMPRLLAPWMDAVTPPFSLTRFDVRPPGATVRVGESLGIAVTVSGPQPSGVTLWTQPTGGTWQQIGMDGGEPGHYTANLMDLQVDTWFYAQGGGSRSARYLIHVSRPPVLQALRATYTFPAYTRRTSATEAVGDRGLHGLMNTRVALDIASNRPLSGGEVTVRSPEQAEQRIPVQPDAKDPTHGRAELVLTRPGTFGITLTAEDGQANAGAGKGKITIERDQRPAVWFEQPGQDLLVTPRMRVPLIVKAEDDSGVARLDMHRVINDLGDSPRALPVSAIAPKVRDETLMDLLDLGVRPGDQITYYATAFDNQPDRPNIGETEPYTLKVVSQEEFDKALKEQRDAAELGKESRDIISAVRDLAERQKELARRMTQLEKQAARNPKDTNVQRQLTEARKEQKALQADARRAAKQLAEYAKSPSGSVLERALKQKLGQMAQAMANTANGPMQGAQSGSPSQAAAQAREAARRLGGVDQQMQRQIAQTMQQLETILPLYADVERVMALLDEQGQLVLKARQFAEKATKSAADRAQLERLASRQNQIQQDLRRLRADLRQHASDAQAQFPKAAASARKIADEIGRRQIAEVMQEGQDHFRQWDGPQGFDKAQAAQRLMQAMVKQCRSCQGSGQSELDIALSRSLGQSGLGKSLAQLAQGMGQGMGQNGQNGQGLGRGGSQSGPGGKRGGGYAMRSAKAYMPSTQAMHGTGGGPRERKQNTVAGTPAPLSPTDVDVVQTVVRKPPRAGDADTARYPEEYRKLVSKYFQSVAEGK